MTRHSAVGWLASFVLLLGVGLMSTSAQSQPGHSQPGQSQPGQGQRGDAPATVPAPEMPLDPARLAAAKEMMEVAGVAKQFEQVMPLLAQQLGQSFVQMSPDKAPEIREVFGQLTTKFIERKKELIDGVAALYARALTVEELSAIMQFYRSPAGARFIAVQPDVMRQSMVLGQRWGQTIGRELEAEARKELKKRGIDL